MDDIPLEECRRKFGAPGISDEELMMRAIMGGTEEIAAMFAAGPPKRYLTSDMPLVMLLNELQKHRRIRYIQVQRGADSIANRGEIAVRVIRACQMLGIETVLATSEADRDAMPAQLADRAVCIGPARSTDSYLNYRAIVTAAMATGCDAVHPGYGFLSEKPELADACAGNGLIFVGPTGDHMRKMGNKITARTLAREAGVPSNAA
ncbi:MAG TPA: biotin carboxylase N-terminal domain-containing protein [Steroidobacteraceae bacterium]|nr:biotin carboxylase N-terminal domain-containing protein [Steroidobacteraceae bacterium]